VEAGLAEEPAPIAGAIARYLGQTDRRTFAPHIARRLKRAAEPTLILSCLLALERLADAEQERAIIPHLAHADLEIRVAAVNALARGGTLRSIEVLLPLANGILVDSTLKEQARRAIDAVRARAPNAEAGCLSIADGSAPSGALSMGADPGALAVLPSGHVGRR
jgi:HEAT repeat protein